MRLSCSSLLSTLLLSSSWVYSKEMFKRFCDLCKKALQTGYFSVTFHNTKPFEYKSVDVCRRCYQKVPASFFPPAKSESTGKIVWINRKDMLPWNWASPSTFSRPFLRETSVLTTWKRPSESRTYPVQHLEGGQFPKRQLTENCLRWCIHAGARTNIES